MAAHKDFFIYNLPMTPAERTRKWRQDNPEKAVAYRKANAERRARQRAEWIAQHPEKRVEYQKRHARLSAECASSWRKQNRAKVNEFKRRLSIEKPHVVKAWTAVRVAIRYGRLKRPSECEQCGASGLVEAHHEDYAKPLDVKWLCKLCHAGTKKRRIDN